jgi:N-acetylmuramoyl-L-alanine amidase
VDVGPTLRVEDSGDDVVALQDHLDRAGYATVGDLPGVFGPATLASVTTFQTDRLLRVDGVCGPATWESLKMAGFTLGVRLLHLRHPMQRGDDVTELQERLCALGFDTGRVDGIFGEQTDLALASFQKNAGVTVDHVCGPSTIAALRNLGHRVGWQESVSRVKERESLRRRSGVLSEIRVAIGEPGDLGELAEYTARGLRSLGCTVLLARTGEAEQLAKLANLADATIYIGLWIGQQPGVTSAYFASHRDSSPAGQRLAECIHTEILSRTGLDDLGISGMTLPELLATRMPATHIELGPATFVETNRQPVMDALIAGIAAWAQPHEPTIGELRLN